MEYLLRKLGVLLNIHIYKWNAKSDRLQCLGVEEGGESPLSISIELRKTLRVRADSQNIPVIYQDTQNLLFGCMREKDQEYIFLGPVCTGELSYVEIHQYYKEYGINAGNELHPPKLRMQKFFAAVEMIYHEISGIELREGELSQENGLVQEILFDREREDMKMEMEDEGYHHTYQEEVRTMNYIREGRTDKIMEVSEVLAETAGKLSENELNAERNLGIAAVTISTRAAIEGGVPPTKAYRLSDIYINKIDKCESLPQLYQYRRKSMYDFAKLVEDEKKRRMYSGYIEGCRDFIHKNYRQKLYIGDIADALGISESHLSRLFKKETGITIQEYILRFRIEGAENLLKYSEASLSEISDYLCFHSQSHFGRIFKQYKNMSPRTFREKYKQREFISR